MSDDYDKFAAAVDKLSDKMSARFDSIDQGQVAHGNRLTSIEVLMGERCAVNTGRIDSLEASDSSSGKTLAKHAVVIGLAFAAITAMVVLGVKAIG